MLDLSCRKREPGGPYHVVTDRWQKFSDFTLSEGSLAELAQSCDEFLVHGVDQEGKRLGIDQELVSLLAAHSPIPVTYAGGVRSLVSCQSTAHAPFAPLPFPGRQIQWQWSGPCYVFLRCLRLAELAACDQVGFSHFGLISILT